MAERVIFVDENDQPIGAGDRKEAWAKGIYVRNVRIVLLDENGRMLLQRRSLKKAAFPDRWTSAASGHVDEGEAWDYAAHREMKEEIGVTTDLKLIGETKIVIDTDDEHIRQFIHVYEGTVDSKIKLDLDPDEVSETKWYDIAELKTEIAKTPDTFTPSFRELIKIFY
ncbi:NUDIX domain-containing protein [Patescibacteria group bacterium]|nr:MAG: NUDIX domain-containing protein [Patescibacteria group bacterium]